MEQNHQQKNETVQKQAASHTLTGNAMDQPGGFMLEDNRPSSILQRKTWGKEQPVQRIAKEALEVGKPYSYDGKVVYYSGFKGGKYCFKNSPTAGISPHKLEESDLVNVQPSSGSASTVVTTPSSVMVEHSIAESSEVREKIADEESSSEESSDEYAPDVFSSATLEKARQDTGGWFEYPPASDDDKLLFLKRVIRVARAIIPKAFNRAAEVPKSGAADYTNTAYECKDALIKAYADDLNRNGIVVKSNYIHPAALERIYQIVKSTTPFNAEAQEADITGVCKDFASLCYGLILQNNVGDIYKPQLAFMNGHVYVQVTIGKKIYAVDAWLNGELLTQAEHEEAVTKTHGITAAKKYYKIASASHQQSLDRAYAKPELARAVWYQNEQKYRDLAIRIWAEGKKKNEAQRGSL